MADEESVPLVCPKCHETGLMRVPWRQENIFYTCRACGAPVLIDKDAATKTLAARRRGRTRRLAEACHPGQRGAGRSGRRCRHETHPPGSRQFDGVYA
ncbi:MAG: hypothetical protein ACREFQ_13935 [Stellaceae bacterium]